MSESHAYQPPAGRPGGDPHDAYYEWERPELLPLVPSGARNVLELGCAAGAFGAALKRARDCRVTGVELTPDVARRAAERLDRVIVGDCEALDLTALLGGERFDCLVAADVLEHLHDPLRVLQRLRGFVTPDATLVASFPNVRHYSVLAGLVTGHWTYADAGILDRTHLRFFTRREFARLLHEAGFVDLVFYPMNLGPYDEWRAAGAPPTITFGNLSVHGLPQAEIADLFAYQYLVTARAGGVGGMTVPQEFQGFPDSTV